MSLLAAHRDRSPGSEGHLSLLADGVQLVGEIACAGALKVEGRLEGVVRSADQVLVSPGGEILGNVHAREVVIAGRVVGDVTAAERVEVRTGGVLQGDISTQRIAIEDGAVLDGRLQVQPAPAVGGTVKALRKTA